MLRDGNYWCWSETHLGDEPMTGFGRQLTALLERLVLGYANALAKARREKVCQDSNVVTHIERLHERAALTFGALQTFDGSLTNGNPFEALERALGLAERACQTGDSTSGPVVHDLRQTLSSLQLSLEQAWGLAPLHGWRPILFCPDQQTGDAPSIASLLQEYEFPRDNIIPDIRLTAETGFRYNSWIVQGAVFFAHTGVHKSNMHAAAMLQKATFNVTLGRLGNFLATRTGNSPVLIYFEGERISCPGFPSGGEPNAAG